MTEKDTTPALDPKVTIWLKMVTGDDIGSWQAREDARNQQLDMLRSKVAGLKGTLDKSFDYTLIGKDTFLWFKNDDLSSKDESHDSMKELDVIDDRKKLQDTIGIADQDAFNVGLAYIELEKLRDKLKDAVDADGNPLFTDQDIMRELYTPLVREGVMSENQVPDKYSEIANVFNESAALYNERLEEFSAARGDNEDFKDKLRFASGLIDDAQSIATPIVKLVGADQAGDIIQSVAIGLQAGLKVTESVIDRSVLDGLDAVAGATGDIIGLFVDKKLGTVIKKSIASGKAGTKAIRAIEAGDYAGALGAIGDSVAAATAAADPKDSNGAKTIGQHISDGLKQAGNIKALAEAASDDPKDPAKIAAALGKIAKDAVGQYTGTLKKDPDEKGISKDEKEAREAHNNTIDGLNETIASSIDLGVATTKTTQGVVTGDEEMTLEGIGDISKSAVGIVGANKKRETGDDSYDRTVARAQDLTDISTNSAKALVHSIMGRRDKLVSDLAAIGQSGRDALITELSNRLDDEITAADEAIEAADDADKKELKSAKAELESTKDELDAIKDEALVKEEALEAIKTDLGFAPPDPEALASSEAHLQEQDNEEMSEATQEFKAMLALSVGGDAAEMDPQARKVLADAFDIDKLITQMQMDQAVLAAAEGIFDTGADIASKVVPQLAAMKAGKEFLKNVVMAAQRAIELNKFLDSLHDASSAVSAYSDAIQKRVTDTRTQLSDHTIQAILEAATAVGAALASTGAGPIAAAGAITQATAEASKGLKALITRIYTEAELAVAWGHYQQALREPLNRKVKRRAMATNPTLSKYALAYGAHIQGDAIAMDAVRKCGLSEEVLASPKTNVNKVVKYLELRFSEDQILLRSVSKPREWLSGTTPELTADSWMSVKRLAIAKAELAPGGGDSRVDRYMLELDSSDYVTQGKALQALISTRRQLQAEEDQLTLDAEEAEEALEALKGKDPTQERDAQAKKDLADQALAAKTAERQRADEEIKAATQARAEKLGDYKKTLSALRDALTAYTPVKTDKSPHEEMSEIATELIAKTLKREREV